MSFQEKTKEQSLVEHLLGNAEALVLTDDQVGRLRLAFRWQVYGENPSHLGGRLARVAAGRIAWAVKKELEAFAGQTAAAAQAAGAEVVQFNDAGAMRIKGRDGIASLLDAGSLTQNQLQAATAYRFCLEFTSKGLKSALDQRGPSSTVLADLSRSHAELQRAYLMARLRGMEMAVARIMGGDARELSVLRLVAGEGQTINGISRGGHARKLNLDALRRALDAVAKAKPAPANPNSDQRALRITGN